ncbi:MAG: metallophosphoesterase family protein [Bacteroidia bacterium]
MNILIISDNHTYSDAALLDQIRWADEVWHAGDWVNEGLVLEIDALGKPLVSVYGNADGTEIRQRFPEFSVIERQGLRIMMVHIAGKIGVYSARVRDQIRLHKPQWLVCGHSHICKVQWDERYHLMHLNPGACGLQGFHKVRTALRLVIEDGTAKQLEVVEWARKSL